MKLKITHPKEGRLWIKGGWMEIAFYIHSPKVHKWNIWAGIYIRRFDFFWGTSIVTSHKTMREASLKLLQMEKAYERGKHEK